MTANVFPVINEIHQFQQVCQIFKKWGLQIFRQLNFLKCWSPQRAMKIRPVLVFQPGVPGVSGGSFTVEPSCNFTSTALLVLFPWEPETQAIICITEVKHFLSFLQAKSKWVKINQTLKAVEEKKGLDKELTFWSGIWTPKNKFVNWGQVTKSLLALPCKVSLLYCYKSKMHSPIWGFLGFFLAGLSSIAHQLWSRKMEVPTNMFCEMSHWC